MTTQPTTPRDFLNQTLFTDLLSWANTHPQNLDTLYQTPQAVIPLFRALPPLSRLYLTRLLFLPPHLSTLNVSTYRFTLHPRQRARDRHDKSILVLRSMRMLIEDDDGGLLRLHEGFGECLRRVVGGLWDGGCGFVEGGRVVEGVVLEEFCKGKWEGILNFLVGGDGGRKGVGEGVVVGLMRCGLLEESGDGMGLTISSLGFRFLLEGSFEQVWVLIRDVVVNEFRGEEVVVYEFLFRVCFCEVGMGYLMGRLKERWRVLVGRLEELGVVMVDGECFFPTQLGVDLIGAASRFGGEGDRDEGSVKGKTAGSVKVIVETNFRVYAYTTSSFQVNLLSLFCHLAYRLPNLVVGYLTRDAVRQALTNGISAAQIIGYLNSHAYVEKGCMQVPANVADEIRLWEAEEERLQTDDAVFLNEFNGGEFQKVLQHAKDIGACLWEDGTKRQIIVRQDMYPNIKTFIKSSS